MTARSRNNRSRGATSHIGVRVAHAAFGGMTALVWLLLVPLTDSPDTGHRMPAAAAASPAVAEWSAGSADIGPSPFPIGARPTVAVGADDAAPGDDESSATDLILPVAVAAVIAGFAAYSLVRRKRRAALRTTTPAGTFEEHLPPLPDLHRRGRRLLVETDDCVRTAAEELRFAVARSGPAAAQPFTDALADARREVEAAFRLRQRLDDTTGTLPPDEERALLDEILARCTMAQRRLDIAAPAFDQLRALERDAVPALQSAEARFRELTGRTATAAATLAGLRERYAPDVVLPVTDHAEHAEDRLVFATAELNRARQFTYAGDPLTAAVHLRAAEGAIDQADVLVTGVERLAAELARAAGATKQGAPREGTYADPLDALCREDRWLLPARSAVATTRDYVTTHRGAVGATARTRLTEAERYAAIAEAAALRGAPTGAEGAGADGAEGAGADGAEGAGADGAEGAGADGVDRAEGSGAEGSGAEGSGAEGSGAGGAGGSGVGRAEGSEVGGGERAEGAGADGVDRAEGAGAGGAEGPGVDRAEGSEVGGGERADEAASPGDKSAGAGAAGQAADSGDRTAEEGTAREAAPPEDGTAGVGAAGQTAPTEDGTAEEDATALGDETAAVETADVESARRAHSLAREAWRLAEQDVREYGEPYEGPVGDGMAGALLGGIILGDIQDDGRITPRGPACFGGTATRARRATSPG
ncbi:hypothetical protein ACIQVC_15340 [Streptomyces sp. NPDC101112]|uniref:hypothetical protein n=1 Tax=Streptomyces sp. NPDC101112 TaxID=3366105 RepID=UPI00381FE407